LRIFKVIYPFLFAVLLFCVYSCSTTNHAPLAKQAYHDLTSRYNAYYNASEKMKAAFKTLDAGHKDNFKEVIPVFTYSDSKESATYASDADDIIKRSTLAIQLHPYANYSDDHFLLIGKASYLKADYDKAAQTFKFISTKYKDGVDYIAVQKDRGKKYNDAVKVKKKKGKKKPEYKTIKNKDGSTALKPIDNRPKRSLWIHESSRSEALIWLTKTYTLQKKYTEAEAVVAFARADSRFYQDYDKELLLTEADIYVRNKNYNSAIAPLEKFLTKAKKKKRIKTRPTFVLAQCYEARGDYARASAEYSKVLKLRPNYDMEFYAKIRKANLGRKGGGSPAEIKSLLVKMSRDGKFRDYLDQIYYELGEINLGESDRISARKNFTKSIRNSTSNTEQQALSYKKLGDMDYEDELYESAHGFYDSSLAVMSKDAADFEPVDTRNKVLTRLVEQLKIVAEEDSLQKLGKMSKEAREAFVKKTVDKKREAEEAAKETINDAKNQFDKGNVNPATATATGVPAPATSNFYFYNVSSRSMGYNDFIKRWGKRKYEENWRRSNKGSTTGTEEDVTATNAAADDSTKGGAKKPGAGTKKADEKSLNEEEQLLAGIPTSAEQLSASDDKIIAALYAIGTIYKDELKNYRKALNAFDDLNRRYAKHKLLLETYYNIYLIANNYTKNTGRAADYRSKIISEFPDSKIAALLQNANYLEQEREKENAISNYYASTYNDYMSGALASASDKILMADVRFKPNTLKGKFDLLNALIMAKENRLEDYTQALNKIVAKTDDAQVKATAEQLLEALNKTALPMVDLSKDTTRALRDSMNAKAGLQNLTDAEKSAQAQSIMQQLQNAKNGVDTMTFNTVQGTAADTAKKGGVVTKGGVTDTTGKKGAVPVVVAPPKPAKPDTVLSPFKYEPNAQHQLIVYLNDATVTTQVVSTVLTKITAFNNESFAANKLTVRQIVLDTDRKLIVVRLFKNAEQAMEYYTVFVAKPELLTDLKTSKMSVSVVSQGNLSILLNESGVDVYNKFFDWKYR
jgi:hypothetical protein